MASYPTGMLRWVNHLGPLDLMTREWSWEGGRTAYLSRRHVGRDHKSGDLLTVGPYCVRVLDLDYCQDAYLVMRGPLAVSWAAAFLYPMKRRLRWVHDRTILTAYIWGLASYDVTTTPSWRDVHALRWLAGRFNGHR